MMTMKAAVLFFLFAATLLQTLLFATASIEATCGQVHKNAQNIDYNFCVKSLHAAPGSVHADTKGLAIVATKEAKGKFLANRDRSDQLWDETNEQPFQECSEVYYDGYSNFDGAIFELNSTNVNIHAAVEHVKASMTDSIDCKKALDETQMADSMKQENEDAHKISNLALAVTTLLH